ncbi:MAG: aminopeptidase [Lachnospiraceae bacterium]|nr:aminopeptidase [Lachnospiraceae bacterium]
MERKNIWEFYSDEQLAEIETFTKNYRDFLDNGKTERECVDTTVNIIEAAGFRELPKLINEGAKLKPGDKVYHVLMNKMLIMFIIGEDKLKKGMNILGSHIDSPRLDIKQNPLYEEEGIAYLDTHYYGGVKKYQWVTIPLALHGVMVKKDGTTVEINIGEEESDPVFFISDLLPHLAAEQMEKKANKFIEGEALDIVVGNKPILIKTPDSLANDDSTESEAAKNAVKKGILEILKQSYDIEEEDFISAELEVVPAGKAREAGFDKSMILAYGQDDRVCSFAGLTALLEAKNLTRTACLIFSDKEEIGSVGATGMHSRFFENTVAELMNLTGDYSELNLRRVLSSSYMLSTDVGAAYDPFYKSSFEKRNTAILSGGVLFKKFTGARGKSGSNDANAEYIGYIRKLMEEAEIRFQTAELGKVDVGGGGTIAYILAGYGMNVIDSGVPVLNMHAPWEATSKADIFEAKRAYAAFLTGLGL